MASYVGMELPSKMSESPPEIVIIGAGPAGCTLAALLAQRGIPVLVFDDDKRPDLLVGESLIPGVVAVMRQLGIEERAAKFCTYKPGASFFTTKGARLHFNFKTVEHILPGYSYNAPRPEFDNLLRVRAEELGARFVKARAEIERCDRNGEPSVRLSAQSRAVAGLADGHAPLLIDSSGRARVFARAMELPAIKGNRSDVAYFAHFENFIHDEVEPGQIIISVLKHGWNWRIPLNGRMSCGIVVNKEHAKELGDTPEERLENAIKTEPLLKEKGANAKRITDVMTYTNYQLLSERGSGPGWVLLGDAFGFVDPMLSPGLFMSLEGARLLDQHVFSKGTAILKNPAALNKALTAYAKDIVEWHHAWSELVEYFYNGQIFRAYVGGQQLSETYKRWPLIGWFEKHASRQVAGMASGGTTRSHYSRNFVKMLCTHIVKDVPPAEMYAVG